MITPKVIGTKVVFGPCRLSYTHVFQKYVPDGNPDSGKYMTNVLIPATEKETLAAIRKAIDEAKEEGVRAKWGNKLPKKLELPLHDGDEKEDDVYDGHFYVNAKSATRPNIVDSRRQPIVDEEEIYSGVWAYVSVTFYPYDVNGNRGVACGLNNLMKFKDDDRLGGRASAEHDFDGIGMDDDDDL